METIYFIQIEFELETHEIMDFFIESSKMNFRVTLARYLRFIQSNLVKRVMETIYFIQIEFELETHEIIAVFTYSPQP